MTTAIGSSSAASWSTALFDKIDTKKQGYIDQAQLEEAFGAENADAAELLMSQLDTDTDGKVSKSELSTAVDRMVEALNAQQDGARMRPAGPPPGGPRPAGGADGADGANATSETYDPADANQDGAVSDTEQAAFDARAAEKRREMDPQREVARALHLLKAYAEQQTTEEKGGAVSAAA